MMPEVRASAPSDEWPRPREMALFARRSHTEFGAAARLAIMLEVHLPESAAVASASTELFADTCFHLKTSLPRD